MLNLKNTSSLVKVVTGSAGAVDVHASFIDFDAPSTFTSSETNTAQITTATTTTVVGSPTGTIVRNVKFLSVRNSHASVSNAVEVLHTDGTNQLSLWKTTLLAQETLVMNEMGVWFVYDTNGGVKMGASAASDTAVGLIQIAVQSDMEAATSTILAVTPGRQHFHPGMAKFVCMTTGLATPALQTPPAYNMTSITDAGVGRLTVTIATDFSSANWCCVALVEYSSTTLTETSITCHPHIRNATLAAGTVEINTHDTTATTNVLRDATSIHVVGYGDQA